MIYTELIKKAYVHATAAVLRTKDCVMDTVTAVQENAEDAFVSLPRRKR